MTWRFHEPQRAPATYCAACRRRTWRWCAKSTSTSANGRRPSRPPASRSSRCRARTSTYRAFLEGGFEIWADFRTQVEELLDAGDAVVALVRSVAVGEGSGAEVEERTAHVIWLRDGIPYRLKVFTSRNQGLQAAGLPVLRPD